MTDKVGFGSTLGTALSGIQRELKSIAGHAEKISNFSERLENGEDLTEPLVGLKQDIRDVQAIRKVVNVVQELEEETLDIIA